MSSHSRAPPPRIIICLFVDLFILTCVACHPATDVWFLTLLSTSLHCFRSRARRDVFFYFHVARTIIIIKLSRVTANPRMDWSCHYIVANIYSFCSVVLCYSINYAFCHGQSNRPLRSCLELRMASKLCHVKTLARDAFCGDRLLHCRTCGVPQLVFHFQALGATD